MRGVGLAVKVGSVRCVFSGVMGRLENRRGLWTPDQPITGIGPRRIVQMVTPPWGRHSETALEEAVHRPVQRVERSSARPRESPTSILAEHRVGNLLGCGSQLPRERFNKLGVSAVGATAELEIVWDLRLESPHGESVLQPAHLERMD